MARKSPDDRSLEARDCGETEASPSDPTAVDDSSPASERQSQVEFAAESRSRGKSKQTITESRTRDSRARASGRAAARSSDPEIDLGTDKKFFKIGEVAKILAVATHVLRYWETEFPAIRPQKSRSQQRVYRRADVQTLLRIKHLLYERKFTIAGARQELAGTAAAQPTRELADPDLAYRLEKSHAKVRDKLRALAAVIREAPRSPELAADPSAFMREGGISRASQDEGPTGGAGAGLRPSSGSAPDDSQTGARLEQPLLERAERVPEAGASRAALGLKRRAGSR